MNSKALPFKGTFLLAFAFFLSVLWVSVFEEGWGLLIFGILFLAVGANLVVTLSIAFFERTKRGWLRLLVSLLALLLFVPAILIGEKIREEIFLFNLAYYQSVADRLIAESKKQSDNSTVQFPPGLSSILVDERASVLRESEGITVMFFSRDSSALGHRGFLYQIDDNPAPLKKSHPSIGFRRLAPEWYVWGA